MIKYVRYNKGSILVKITQLQKVALFLMFMLPIMLELLDNFVLNGAAIIYIIQVITISLGILCYILSFALLTILMLIYSPIITERGDTNDYYGDS